MVQVYVTLRIHKYLCMYIYIYIYIYMMVVLKSFITDINEIHGKLEFFLHFIKANDIYLKRGKLGT